MSRKSTTVRSMRSSNATLAEALRKIAESYASRDGAVEATLSEASLRIEEFDAAGRAALETIEICCQGTGVKPRSLKAYRALRKVVGR